MKKVEFYSADPLARLLIDKFCLTPISLAAISVFTTISIYITIAWFSNTLVSGVTSIGFLEDWVGWIWNIFINPLVYSFYLWAAVSIGNLLKELAESDVVQISDQDFRNAVDICKQPWKKFLALLLAIFGSIGFFTSRSVIETWVSFGLAPKIVSTFFFALGTYMGTMLVFSLITNVWILNRVLSHKEINVNPLHPDRCGGLRPLSQYSMKTAYLIGLFGIMLGFTEYLFITEGVIQEYWFLHFGIPLYIISSTTCFFGPLLAAHRGMKGAKEKLLSGISHQFQEDYLRATENLNLDAEALDKEIAKIQKLRAFYTLTDEFPVWPFDIKTLRNYSLSVVTPLIPPLAAIIQKYLGLLLKSWGWNFG